MRRRKALTVAAAAILILVAATLQFREVRRLKRAESDDGLLAMGARPPAFSLPSLAADPVRLESLRGKIVVVSFWATWCLPCRVEMPEMASFAESWNKIDARRADLVYVAINEREELGAVKLFARDPRLNDVRFALDRDGRVADAWKVTGYPTTYLVSPEGDIVDKRAGYDASLVYRFRRSLQAYLVARKPKGAKP